MNPDFQSCPFCFSGILTKKIGERWTIYRFKCGTSLFCPRGHEKPLNNFLALVIFFSTLSMFVSFEQNAWAFFVASIFVLVLAVWKSASD